MTNFAKLALILTPAAAMIGVGAYVANRPTAGEQAERQYEIVVQAAGATPAVRCSAATTVADAYLRDENAAAYQEWHMRAEDECMHANLGF